MKNIKKDELVSEDNENVEPCIEIIETSPYLFKTTLRILERFSLCPECLGRQFSYLGTKSTNTERANAILLGLTMETHRLLIKTSRFMYMFIHKITLKL